MTLRSPPIADPARRSSERGHFLLLETATVCVCAHVHVCVCVRMRVCALSRHHRHVSKSTFIIHCDKLTGKMSVKFYTYMNFCVTRPSVCWNHRPLIAEGRARLPVGPVAPPPSVSRPSDTSPSALLSLLINFRIINTPKEENKKSPKKDNPPGVDVTVGLGLPLHATVHHATPGPGFGGRPRSMQAFLISGWKAARY